MSKSLNLELVLRELAERKICCGILTTISDGVLVWMSHNGKVVEDAEHTLSLSSDVPDQIARWLRETADRLFGPAPSGPANGPRRTR